MLCVLVSDQAHYRPAAANRNFAAAANGMPLTAPAKDPPAGGGLPSEGLRSVAEGSACLVHCQSSDHWLAHGSFVKVFNGREWGTLSPGSTACLESEATHANLVASAAGCMCELDFEADNYVQDWASCLGCTAGKASTSRLFTDTCFDVKSRSTSVRSSAASCENAFSRIATEPSVPLTAAVANTPENMSLVQPGSPTLDMSFFQAGRVDNNSDKLDMIVDSALIHTDIEVGSLVVQIDSTCEVRGGCGSKHAKVKNRLVVKKRLVAACTQFMQQETTLAQTPEDAIAQSTNLIE